MRPAGRRCCSDGGGADHPTAPPNGASRPTVLGVAIGVMVGSQWARPSLTDLSITSILNPGQRLLVCATSRWLEISDGSDEMPWRRMPGSR
jgi:hypothetical protein